MVATPAMIGQISPYQVDDETQFTKATFATLSAAAQRQLDAEKPTNLPAELYDLAHAYLIAHFYTAKLGKTGYSSERIGDYSYTKEAGTSTYLLSYRMLLSDLSLGEESQSDYDLIAVTRADANTRKTNLDRSTVVSFEDED